VIAVTYIITWVIGAVLGAIGGSSLVGIWLTSAIAQIITAPFMALVLVLLYVDLRARHEGLSADQLGMQLDAAH
jgi:predicted branched-subunit amino acid permease